MIATPLRMSIIGSLLFAFAGELAGRVEMAKMAAAGTMPGPLAAGRIAWLASLAEPAKSLFSVGMAAVVAASLVGAIGMYQYRRWGRALSVAATVAWFCLAFTVGGFVIGTPVKGTLMTASAMLSGASLALAFWSAEARRFDPPPRP